MVDLVIICMDKSTKCKETTLSDKFAEFESGQLQHGKGKAQYICIAPYCRQPTSKALRYGNTLSRDHTVLPPHPRVYLQTEWTIPVFAFPAEAGTHLPTPKGWKAELAWATRTVSKQSAQDCYAMFIAADNRSKYHTSLGKWVYAACPELLPGVVEAGVEPRPFESQVRHANHYTTESTNDGGNKTSTNNSVGQAGRLHCHFNQTFVSDVITLRHFSMSCLANDILKRINDFVIVLIVTARWWCEHL